jgi:Raf kinase inhibitor-like YbhB/YbcL family protein
MIEKAKFFRRTNLKPITACMTVATLCALAFINQAQAAASMTVSSASFQDGGDIPKLMAGEGSDCGGGQAITPAVRWANLPAGSKSVATVISDPDGGKGQGVFHWVAYNIPAAQGSLKEGSAPRSTLSTTVGLNSAGAAAYKGLCPPTGDSPHHYVLTVIATDQEPGSLPAGLDHTRLLESLKGHTLGAQTVVGRYGH